MPLESDLRGCRLARVARGVGGFVRGALGFVAAEAAGVGDVAGPIMGLGEGWRRKARKAVGGCVSKEDMAARLARHR
jgi:hypothetical protein